MMEAQNKRHDVMNKLEQYEAKRLEIEEERQRRLDEKKVKEEAVAERRKALEDERVSKLEQLQDRRLEQEAKIDEMVGEKARLRGRNSEYRDRIREVRLSARSEEFRQRVESLQARIRIKEEESRMRYEAILEERRKGKSRVGKVRVEQRLPVMGSEGKGWVGHRHLMGGSAVIVVDGSKSRRASDGTNQSTKSSVVNGNNSTTIESATQQSRPLIESAVSADTDTVAEILESKLEKLRVRRVALRKRTRKLRSRMSLRGREFEELELATWTNAPDDSRLQMQRLVREINRQQIPKGPGRFPAIERSLNEATRLLERSESSRLASRNSGIFTSVSRLFLLQNEASIKIPRKILSSALKILTMCCAGIPTNCIYLLNSNKISPLVDSLYNLLDSDFRDPLIVSLLGSLAVIIAGSVNFLRRNNSDSHTARVNDLIAFIVSLGVVDKFAEVILRIVEPVDDNVLELIAASVNFLSAVTCIHADSAPQRSDSTQLMACLLETEACGVVSLLYGLLFHSEAGSALPRTTLTLATEVISLLGNVGLLDAGLLQRLLADESRALEMRHILSHLLSYSNAHRDCENLQRQVILLVGFFTSGSPGNQSLVHSGRTPVVLHQLLSLPVCYFSNPDLMDVLFPTLVACCYDNPANKSILEQEMSCGSLSTYIRDCERQRMTQPPPPSTRNKSNLEFRFPVILWSKAISFFDS